MVLVGPQPLEVQRLADLAESIGAYETGPGWFVVVDDAPVCRNLEHFIQLPPGIKVVCLHHLREGPPVLFRHGGGLCSQVMLALKWVQENTNARFVLKLDTDSLIINPFRDQLAHVFNSDGSPGMVGAHTLTPNGTTRTWHHHGATVMRLYKAPFNWRHPLRGLRQQPETEMTRLIAAALANQYNPGEHCLGGGYAVSREALDRMARSGFLVDPLPRWINVDMAEDVMVGLHVRAVGMKLDNLVRPGEVFGVRYQGLPDSPQRLVDLGYSVIHSIKNDPGFNESTIRVFFKHRRDNTPSRRRYVGAA
jgi:hypothetical protein